MESRYAHGILINSMPQVLDLDYVTLKGYRVRFSGFLWVADFEVDPVDRDLFKCDDEIAKFSLGNGIHKTLTVRVEILKIGLNRTFSTNSCYKDVGRVMLGDMLTCQYVVTHGHSVGERHCVECGDGNMIIFYA